MSEKILQKSFVILMMIALAVSFMPAAIAQSKMTETATASDDANGADGITTTGGTVDNRVRQCVAFLSQKNIDDRPALTCSMMLQGELNCVQYMKSRNIVNPETICSDLLKTDAPTADIAISTDTDDTNTGWRIMAAKRIASQYKGSENFIDGLDEDKSKIFARLSRTEQKKILEMDDAERIKKLEKYTIIPVENGTLSKKRVISKSKLELAAQKYERARYEYERTNRLYNQKKNLFLEAKNRLRACDGEETEECKQLRVEAQEHAREYVVNGALMAIEHLNKIRSSVESAEGMDEESASEIIDEIDEAIAEIEAGIENVKEAETKEEIQDGAKEIAMAWRDIKNAQTVYAARVINSGMWNIVKKSEKLSERLENALVKMDEKGINIENIDEMVDEINGKISNAIERYEEAEDLLDDARELKNEDPSDENIKVLVEMARLKLRDAQNEIKDAYRLLPEIIREIYSSGGMITSGDEDEFEVVEINDDDDDEQEDDGTSVNGTVDSE